jgi:hypothetical protein
MLILMTAALAAAQPAPTTQPGPDTPKHEQMKCCECCKDMAGKHEGHAGHDGHAGR